MRSVVNIKRVGKVKVCDLSVKDAEHYILENGIGSHNTGGMYSSDTVWTIGKQQDKDTSTSEISGYNFIINIEKSRHVRERTKIPITVSYQGGIQKYSGLDAFALSGGFIVKGSKGKYNSVNMETGEIGPEAKVKTIGTNESFWEPILQNPKFKEYITSKLSISHNQHIENDELYEGEDI